MKQIICTILFAIAFCETHPQDQKQEFPNIIVIYVDDLGYGDLSSYGGDIPTPHIDDIGKNGLRFTDFYVAAPVCTPSRFALLTGSYPIRSQQGLRNVLFPFSEGHLDKSETTLAEYLKREGYVTAIMGKWHLGLAKESYYPTYHGFDNFYGFLGGCIDYYHHSYGTIGKDWHEQNELKHEKGYSTDLITRRAIDFIKNSNDTNNPFFLYLTYNAPHYGKSNPNHLPDHTVTLHEAEYQGHTVSNTLQAPAKYIDKFSHITDIYRRVYSAMVSNLDDNIGQLLQEVEDQGLLDNTMIWFMSDNGGYSETHRAHADNGELRGEKGSLWEGGIRVPAMVSWGSKIPKGQVSSAPIVNVDIVPTIASIVGFETTLPVDKIDGRDISDVLFKGEHQQRDIYWKFNKQSAIRSGDWKLLNGNMLFNLRIDKGEREDLSLQYPEKVRELQMRFEKINVTVTKEQ